MTQNPPHIPVRKLVSIRGIPGRAHDLRVALLALEQATREEPGCIRFAFYQALACEDDFILLEEFVDQAALATHLGLPHTQAFFDLRLTGSVRAVTLPAQ